MRVIQPNISNSDLSHGNPFSFAEIGRIGAGIKDASSTSIYPKATDYFIPRGDFVEEFTTMYGEQPNKLYIYFDSDEEVHSCTERLELRDKSGRLYGFSDGYTYYFYSEKTKRFTVLRTIDKFPTIAEDSVSFLTRGMPADKAKHIKWKLCLYLRFFIRDFPVSGYWQMVIHGKETSIPQIRGTYDQWKAALGTIRRVPFILTVKKAKPDQSGASHSYNVMSMIPNFSMEAAHNAALRMQQPNSIPFQIIQQELNIGASYVTPLTIGPATEET